MDTRVSCKTDAIRLCAQVPELTLTDIPSKHRPILAAKLKTGNSPLRNEIHKMFAIEKWESQPTPQQYDALVPALQIATRLLIQTPVLDFFAHILFADLIIIHNKGHLVSNATSRQPLAHLAVQEALASFATRDDLRFGFDACEMHNEQQRAHGMAITSTCKHEDFCRHGHLPVNHFHKPRIVLNIGYLTILDKVKGPDLEVIQLCIAIILLHELVHIMWSLRVSSNSTRTFDEIGRMGEPAYSLQDRSGDLGFALEDLIFGGTFEPMDHRKQVVPYYNVGMVPCRGGEAWSRVVVPAWWTHMWFDEALYVPDVFEKVFSAGELVLPSRRESGWQFEYEEEWREWRLWYDGRMSSALFKWRSRDSFLQREHLEVNVTVLDLDIGKLTLGPPAVQKIEMQKTETPNLESTFWFDDDMQAFREIDVRMLERTALSQSTP